VDTAAVWSCHQHSKLGGWSATIPILIIIGFGLGTFFGIALENKSHILAVLTVIGTVGAVIWAVARDTIVKYIYRPILNMKFYEPDAPYLRYVPPSQPYEQPHQHVLTLYISNTGKSVAESCQPLITKMWVRENDSWSFPDGWVPLPLNWVFESELEQKYVSKRNIVPNKPYLFNLCTIHDNNFLVLTAPIMSRSQPSRFSTQTTYCLELTVFSVNAKPVKQYYYIKWSGPFDVDLSAFKTSIDIYESSNSPESYRPEQKAMIPNPHRTST